MSRRVKVLLVEDEPMITLLYEDVLEDSEFELVNYANCNKEAVEALVQFSPDFVIVDYVIADGPCLPVITLLQDTKTPFLVVSGYEKPPIPDVEGVPWLAKPFTAEALLKRLHAMWAATGDRTLQG